MISDSKQEILRTIIQSPVFLLNDKKYRIEILSNETINFIPEETINKSKETKKFKFYDVLGAKVEDNKLIVHTYCPKEVSNSRCCGCGTVNTKTSGERILTKYVFVCEDQT